MNKKIYLIRSGSTKFGGAEKYLTRFSKALAKENIDYQIVNSSIPKILPSWIRAILFNIQLQLTKRNKFYYSLDRITCPDLYRAGDGVHKVFLSIEKKSNINLLHPTYLYLERHCLKNSKSIIANSNMVKKEIIETYNINPSKINVIYNGINFSEINYEKSFKKISSEFSITQNQSVLLYVGSGFKRKGVEEFLRIFSELKTDNVVGFIVGKEKNMGYYQKLSRKFNIDKKIFFTGPRLDVIDFYSISDIFLFPSHYDPFSNVVLEAMHFENVVFTTTKNGASEILHKSFLMKKPYDKNTAGLIDKILGSQTSLIAEKKKNRKISMDFSIEKNLTKTLDVIKKIEQ